MKHILLSYDTQKRPLKNVTIDEKISKITKLKMEIITEIKNWTIENDQLIAYMTSLPDWKFSFTIKKVRKARTSQQNKYYRAILWIIGMEIWYHPHELHEIMKMAWMKKTTTDMNTYDFSTYLESVRNYFATEFWIFTPDP